MSDQDSNPKQTGHTPPKLTQSLLDPYCAVDQEGKPVFEILHSFEPSIAGEYVRSTIEAFNSHAALAEIT